MDKNKVAEVFDFDENLTSFAEYNVLGNLPDPFLKENGERIKTQEEWKERRREIYKTAVELQYGTMPPKPEFFDCRIINGYTDFSVKITCGTKEKQTDFIMRLFLPEKVKNPPVIIDGDLCFKTDFISSYVNEILDSGIAYVTFNRCELAYDMPQYRRMGPLYDIYPEYSFGALGAWAWGYARCADALEILGMIDMSCIAFTGHSRGAKAAMLAGVLDERAAIVNPNDSNGASCGCYRIHGKGIKENGTEEWNETLDDMFRNQIDFWLGPEMEKYRKCEENLPFDCHFLKALVAPRVLLVAEAASDMWTNPIGSWQTSMAAKEVFDFLGCGENMKWYFRKGYHKHTEEDISVLVNLIKSIRGEEKLWSEFYSKTPFEKKEKIWDWTKPETE